MARHIKRLSARGVEKASSPGRYADGGGLYLLVDKAGAKRWIFRFRWKDDRTQPGNGRLRDMGLGNLSSVPLSRARDLAEQCRADLQAGLDPITTRESRLSQKARAPTFGRCADELVDALEAGWRNAKHRHQWRHTLTDHAAAIRSKPVDTINTADVLTVLKPLWQSRPQTASRLRGRIEAVLDAARARGFIPEGRANPARWRGHLDKLLSKRVRLTQVHHPAMPFRDVPEFIARLRATETTTALVLEYIILTAARSGEALGARWTEIDMKAKVWTVPRERMKTGIEHRAPLSDRAVDILKAMQAVARGEFVFPSHRSDRPLSGMACPMLLRRMGVFNVTVHGFRSAFRDWCGEATNFPREIAEAALAHAVGDAVERAYRRGDALERRRKLMDDWARYCGGGQSSNVVPLKRA
jgi:integrase